MTQVVFFLRQAYINLFQVQGNHSDAEQKLQTVEKIRRSNLSELQRVGTQLVPERAGAQKSSNLC